MGSIKLKWYYTELVEHYFRMAVRYTKVSRQTPKDWFVFTRSWIGMQSAEDKKFILSVFAYQFRHTVDGLNAFACEEPVPLQAKRERLALLEKQFAIDAGLFDENANEE
ncbi:MAG: hypothetical protein RR998_02295 [Oscillospiraceae bacterium]